MGLNFTPLLSYHEIRVDKIEIYDDAWGFSREFGDVFHLLDQVKPVVDKRVTRRLIKKIRQSH
ncbi:MAG: hypothetical protein WCE64_09685 [Bacteroidales bacterium]